MRPEEQKRELTLQFRIHNAKTGSVVGFRSEQEIDIEQLTLGHHSPMDEDVQDIETYEEAS